MILYEASTGKDIGRLADSDGQEGIVVMVVVVGGLVVVGGVVEHAYWARGTAK